MISINLEVIYHGSTSNICWFLLVELCGNVMVCRFTLFEVIYCNLKISSWGLELPALSSAMLSIQRIIN